jgi:hypothetical protein
MPVDFDWVLKEDEVRHSVPNRYEPQRFVNNNITKPQLVG